MNRQGLTPAQAWKDCFKTLLKVATYLILAYIILVVLEYARQGFINDLSLQRVDLSLQQSVKVPTYLISYADGKESIYRNQNAMTHYVINKGIDFILNYKKKHLKPEFIKKNQEIFQEKIGAGMWLWKPYIILETMKAAPEGAIILYLDCAFILKKHISHLIHLLGNKDVLLIHDHDRKNGFFIKGDSFALMDCMSQECRNGPLMWGAMILVRNTKYSRAFIEKWLARCEDIRILSSKDYQLHPNYTEFLWHHFDQSVLSLVYYLHPEAVQKIEFDQIAPFVAWFHRKEGPSSPLKSWYTIYGAEPLINFNTKGKVLPSTALLNTGFLVRARKWFLEHFIRDQ